jgi:predicted XRE-type DNA-binding protein
MQRPGSPTRRPDESLTPTSCGGNTASDNEGDGGTALGASGEYRKLAGAGQRWQPLRRTYGGLRQVIRKRITSVWDAIEDSPEKAENMRLRSSLMIALKEHLVRSGGSGLSQRQIAKHFGVTQLRVSDLMHGKIDEFGLDALVNMAVAAGLRVKLSVRKAA